MRKASGDVLHRNQVKPDQQSFDNRSQARVNVIWNTQNSSHVSLQYALALRLHL